MKKIDENSKKGKTIQIESEMTSLSIMAKDISKILWKNFYPIVIAQKTPFQFLTIPIVSVISKIARIAQSNFMRLFLFFLFFAIFI